MNALPRFLPAVVLMGTLAACGGELGSSAVGDKGSYAVDLSLGAATSPMGQPPSFWFQVVKLGTPCDVAFDAGDNPVTVGACTYSPPPLIPTLPSGCGTPDTGASAGALSLVDSTRGSTLGRWTSETDSATFPDAAWGTGDTVVVAASGAEVPPFSISAPVLSAPSVTLPASFSASHDLTLSWTPDPRAGTMVVILYPKGTAASLTCRPPDAAGTVVIDASLLSKLQGATSPLAIEVYRETVATLSDGPAQVRLISYGSAETRPIVLD